MAIALPLMACGKKGPPDPPPGESQAVAWFSWDAATALADEALAGALVTARRLTATGSPPGAGGTPEEHHG